MQTLELNIKEIDQLIDAIKAWEREPASSGMVGSMLGAMFSKDEQSSEARMKASMAKTGRECQDRENKVIMLKAKLIQYRNRLSEHEVTNP